MAKQKFDVGSQVKPMFLLPDISGLLNAVGNNQNLGFEWLQNLYQSKPKTDILSGLQAGNNH